MEMAIINSMSSPDPDPIPESTAPFFQEYTFADLDPARDGDLIIERILAYGSREEIGWVFKRYGRLAVREWVEQMGAKRLPARRNRLFCVIFELPIPATDPNKPWKH